MFQISVYKWLKNKVISEISLVLVPANIFLVRLILFYKKALPYTVTVSSEVRTRTLHVTSQSLVRIERRGIRPKKSDRIREEM